MSSRLLYCLLVFCLAKSCLAGDESASVATVNGEPISAAQLDRTIRPQLEAMEERVRQLRQAALNKLIDNLLLEQAARAEGVAVDEYLEKYVESVTVSAAEVERAYHENREQFPGILAAEARYRLRRTLEDNARAAALRNVLERLREKALITNQLISDSIATLAAAAHEGPSRGGVEATVTIMEFSDFECPYCRAAQPVVQRIMEQWRGRVRHVFKHFPLDRHAGAMLAARASVCANGQDRFWALHDKLFALGKDLREETVRAAAVGSGLHMADFDTCMASEDTVGHVRRDMLVGRSAGVAGTPTFFVNGQPVPTSDLEAAITKLLGGTE